MKEEKSSNDLTSCPKGTEEPQWRKIVKRICLVALILVVWALLTIPIVFNYLPLPQDQEEQNLTTNSNVTGIVGDSLGYFPCRDNFFREQQFNICVPMCPSWRQEPAGVSILIDVVVFVSYFTGFVAAAAILVISVIRRQSMLAFPNSIVVYLTAVYFIQNICYVITFFDRASLYCSSENLFETLAHVTPYCVITGIVQTYSTLSASLWWFMLAATLFWKIYFPFHSQSFQKTKKINYLHIGCSLIGLLVPLTPTIALMSGYAVKIRSTGGSFISGGLGFTYVRFPPQPCNGNNKDIVFYSIILPTNLLLAVGITLTILILWRVHKKFGIHNEGTSRNVFRIGSSERKILLIIFYYIISTVINLTAYADFSHKSDLFQTRLVKYFVCEQMGHDPENPCDRRPFEETVTTALVVLSYGFHGTLPLVQLVFALNIKDIKVKCSQLLNSKPDVNKDIKNSATSTML